MIGDASTQELRDELEKRGLDTSGLKGQLVERLEEALAGEGAGETRGGGERRATDERMNRAWESIYAYDLALAT